MDIKKCGTSYFIRLDPGEEIIENISKLCVQKDILLGKISGIGATNEITLGLFDTSTKEYHSQTFQGDHEILSLNGNITSKDNKPYLHIHISLANSGHKSYGGHLNRAVISATCEIIIDEYEGEIGREKDEKTGLSILTL